MFKMIKVWWNCYRLQKSAERETKLKAAKVLGKLKDPRAVEPLIKALGDEHARVRKAASEALGQLQPTKALGYKDARVRRASAEALDQLKDPRNEQDSAVEKSTSSSFFKLTEANEIEALSQAVKFGNGREICFVLTEKYGTLEEVMFFDGFKAVLFFRDGVGVIVGEDSYISILTFGYVGQGPSTFSNCLLQAGFSDADTTAISPPLRLRKDGTRVFGKKKDDHIAWQDGTVTSLKMLKSGQEIKLEKTESVTPSVEELVEANLNVSANISPKRGKIKPLPPTGDSYIDSCFNIRFEEIDDERQWRDIDDLRRVTELGSEGNLEEAMSLLESVWDEYEDFDFIYYWKAELLKKMGRSKDARVILKKGLHKSKHKYALYEGLGEIELDDGTLHEAVMWWIKSAVSQVCNSLLESHMPFLYLAYVAEFYEDEVSKNKLLEIADIIFPFNVRLTSDGAYLIRKKAAEERDRSIIKAIKYLCQNFLLSISNKSDHDEANTEIATALEDAREGQRALLKAVAGGDLELVKTLLEAGADVNAKSDRGNTALMSAAENGHLELVKTLLEAGADVNGEAIDGETALMIAVNHNRSDIIKILLNNKADINKRKTRGGATALRTAAYRGHLEVLKTLLEANAYVDAKDNEDKTALWVASYKGHLEIAKALLKANANVNSKDNVEGVTALWMASKYGHTDIVKELLELGADVNAKAKNNHTPLSIAKQKGHTEIVELIKKYDT